MASKVLRPHDALVHRFHVHTTSCPCRRNFLANGASTSLASNQNHQRRPSAKQEKKRPNTAAAETWKPNQGGEPCRRSEIGGAVGKITLLRRGESLNSLTTKIADSNPADAVAEDTASVHARSDSELVVPWKVRKAAPPKVEAYAGAAFDSSPSPSPRCLPQPTFFSKKRCKRGVRMSII